MSTGPDSASPRMLKSTARSIAPSLTKLFNAQLHQEHTPKSETCKNSSYRQKGDKALPFNYRPITILLIVSRRLTMETKSAQFFSTYAMLLTVFCMLTCWTSWYASLGPKNYYLDSQLFNGQISDCCCRGRTIHQPPSYLWHTTRVGIRSTSFHNLHKWCSISNFPIRQNLHVCLWRRSLPHYLRSRSDSCHPPTER